MQDFSNKRNKLQKCSGCCPQSRCPKTSHHHAFTLWRNMAKLLQAWFPITWQLLIIQILFITSRPVKDVLQVKRPRCLVKIWNVSPWNCLSPTVSNKTDFTFARHFIFLFYFVFRMYSFRNMVCATEIYLLSSISVVRQFSENIFFYKHTFAFIFQFKLEKYSEKNKKSLQLW